MPASGKTASCKTVGLADVRATVLALPGVEEGPCYGTPGFRVRGKLIARLREDNESLVVKVRPGERALLIERDPEVFFFTEHYRNYPHVLVHLSRVDPDDLREILTNAWRSVAPKRLLSESDGRGAANKRDEQRGAEWKPRR